MSAAPASSSAKADTNPTTSNTEKDTATTAPTALEEDDEFEDFPVDGKLPFSPKTLDHRQHTSLSLYGFVTRG